MPTHWNMKASNGKKSICRLKSRPSEPYGTNSVQTLSRRHLPVRNIPICAAHLLGTVMQA
uniref:Uncharacterized protein n=1 Tax=Neisseria meningitidis alpha153 TaxID=663926 RepID=C6SAX3_NEIME|nr:hypothetical protein predicted by Glimmer/Critica [Neisseria meningitidis alpha153]